MTVPFHNSARIPATFAAIALVASALVAAATPAGALDVTVSDADEFLQAIEDANVSGDSSHTITLDADFTWDQITAYYDGTANLTIQGAGHTVTLGDSSDGFLTVYSPDDADVIVEDLTITGGTPEIALLLDADYVTVDGLTVTDVNGEYTPVVLRAANGVEVLNSEFTDNSSSEPDEGGALWAASWWGVAIEDSTFTGNVSNAGSGGAIVIEADTDEGEISDSVFTDNEAALEGGAVYVRWGDGYTYDSEFTGNSAGSFGGAIVVNDGFLELNDSTFTGNSAPAGGAVAGYQYTDAFSSTFTGNRATDGDGGAVYTTGDSDYSYYWNSTFHDNSATGAGGAIFAWDDDVQVYHSTFTANSASEPGSHITVDDDYLQTYASVFADAIGAPGCEAWDEVESWDYNFDDDGSCSNSHDGENDFGSGADPLLGALQDNGGPTPTRMPSATSPLLNHIPTEVCEDAYEENSTLQYDQRGLDREAMLEASETGCDVGAVERLGTVTFSLMGEQGAVQFSVDGALEHIGECDATWPASAAPVAPPAGVSFPHGLFGFCVDAGVEGATVTVTVTLPSPVNAAYKADDDGWYPIPGATFSGTTVAYQLTDGGELDQDGERDGVIVDPLALGVGASFTG